MSSSEKVTLPVAIVPLFLGFGLLLTGAILLFFGLNPAMDSETTGSISEIEQGTSSGGNPRCSLNARFTVRGQTYAASSLDASGSNCEREIGEPVAVQYNAANPTRNQIKAGYLPWAGAAVTAGGLLLLLLAGALFVRSSLKRRR
jgi:hypothetical protein